MRGVRGVTNATSLEIVSRAVNTSGTSGHRLPAVGAGRRGLREVRHEAPGDARPEDRIARRHRPHRPQDLGARRALQQVAAGTGPDRRLISTL